MFLLKKIKIKFWIELNFFDFIYLIFIILLHIL